MATPAKPPSPPEVHPVILPLSYLLGTWRGEGQGGYPTINSFNYGEEIHFSHSGKPVIAYTQKTWKLASGEPMHAESGYWRPKPDGTIEVVIAQSTGIVEVQSAVNQYISSQTPHLWAVALAVMKEQTVIHKKGTYHTEEKIVKLQSELVGNASKVKEITRVFKLVNGELSYVVQMATNINNSLRPHLEALLKKL